MKNAFKIFAVEKDTDEKGKEYIYLVEPEEEKLKGEFCNEVECHQAVTDAGAQGEFVFFNIKTF